MLKILFFFLSMEYLLLYQLQNFIALVIFIYFFTFDRPNECLGLFYCIDNIPVRFLTKNISQVLIFFHIFWKLDSVVLRLSLFKLIGPCWLKTISTFKTQQIPIYPNNVWKDIKQVKFLYHVINWITIEE